MLSYDADSMASRIGGVLYFQSNVEDVAVYMKNVTEKVVSKKTWLNIKALGTANAIERAKCPMPFECKSDEAIQIKNASTTCSTQRSKLYRDSGGERAVGKYWLKASPFPNYARTETEASYELDGKPVHRIGWIVRR